ncbi:cAMP phosphodiesterases class-II-domain-containing protein [Chaetomium tenue]|uniref:cAMP phosphodiesterases class-II-domain-containing protein n=1 Tax=Chaetomium tenue TaxID=1854479 RepID=A0ACB7PDI7_9PEZI|nr:cAMP phosphodiesterases class-II-domain-containing protein [Chaetomium globosum]
MGGGSNGAALGAATAAAATSEAAGDAPALQVIVLGAGGGPLENNVTAFLVRSVATGWARGSLVAVDAGVHLSAIKTILEETQPASLGQPDGPPLPHTLTTGPFAGLEVHNTTAEANAAQIHKSLIETYLITHPHLDHIAGFVVNTAGLPGTRPKRVAGLPSTITALKTHIFNNVIWPNLSDENNGAGLVTYMRLVEGGSPALGEGEGKGYLEVCGGLAVKVWSVSHGHCIERHSHRGSSSTRHGSFDASSTGLGPVQSMPSPARNLPPHTSLPTNIGAILQQHERLQASSGGRRGSSFSGAPPVDESVCVYDSSVYFIRDISTGREILIFGDVEPDSISLSPRNRQVWQEAAPKIAAGKLSAIFIECSYDDSRSVERLFGHLTPRFIYEEMTALAEEVVAARQANKRASSTSGGEKKRKRVVSDAASQAKRKSTSQPGTPRHIDTPLSPRSLDPRRGVDSTTSSVSRASSFDHTQDLFLPKTLNPLPAHPLRSAITSEWVYV